MNQAILTLLAISLLLTLVLEIGFFLLVGKRDKKDLLLVVLVNVLTNPVVVLLYWLTGGNVLILILLEVFAVVTEGYYYRKYGQSFRRPYLFSFGANMFSYWLGVLIQMFL